RLLTRARLAIASTRAPVKPFAVNSCVAAPRIAARVRAGTRVTARLGPLASCTASIPFALSPLADLLPSVATTRLALLYCTHSHIPRTGRGVQENPWLRGGREPAARCDRERSGELPAGRGCEAAGRSCRRACGHQWRPEAARRTRQARAVLRAPAAAGIEVRP